MIEGVGLQLHCAKHLAWLGQGDFVASPLVQEVPRIGCCYQLVVWLWLYSVCPVGSRQSCHSVDKLNTQMMGQRPY